MVNKHKKMFDIISHQGDANYSHNEIALYCTREPIIKKEGNY